MKEHIEHLGGWSTLRGIFAVAGCVALPLGAPLAEALAHLVPEVILPHLHLTVTGTLWGAMSLWLLQGIRSHVAVSSALNLSALPTRQATSATQALPVTAVPAVRNAVRVLPRPSLRASQRAA